MKFFGVTVFFNLMTMALVAQSAPPQNLSTDEIRVIELKKQFALQGKVPASPLTSLRTTVKGTFWRNPEWIKLLDLSSEQQNKMDDIFHQYRLKLIDLTASLQKEELILDPLLGPARPLPDLEAKILAQIDRVADARAELEKANSKMLFNILQVLTAEQWSKLPILAKKGATVYTNQGK